MSNQVVVLDVREDIQKGREPFSKIMQTVAGLRTDQKLLLIAPFQPVPLFGVMANQGFSHRAKPTAAGDWEVLFTRSSAAPIASEKISAPSPSSARGTKAVCGGTPVFEVDARGLEPPQPLVAILEKLETLPQGAALRARTDRRPLHLYDQLDERGFTWETEKQSDGSFVTHIRRR
jgi:uncharacterized protein (DUF2249 family)